MPIIESLRNYPVAGMDGYPVNELTITKEAIVGNRSFAVVLESEIDKYLQDASYIPLRMTQVRFPHLALFKTENSDGKLIISYQEKKHIVDQSVEVEDSDRTFHTPGDQIAKAELLEKNAIPFRVARSSRSQRWATDCGNNISHWLSKLLGEPVRLVKAVKHPDSTKHHFTWYTALHAISSESVNQLAEDTNTEIDLLSFRYNVLLSGTDHPYEEESWTEVIINSTRALIESCKRCGYIGIDRTTGILAQHIEVVQNIAKEHEMNFGIYIQPKDERALTIKIGDIVSPIS